MPYPLDPHLIRRQAQDAFQQAQRTSPPTCTARRPAAHTPLARNATKVSSSMAQAQSQPRSRWPCRAAAPSNHHEPIMRAKAAQA
jgi:hypothetical protein